MTCLKLGMRYSEDEEIFKYTKEAKEEDKKLREEGESTNQRMARVCLKAMNSVSEDLKFTVEVPEDFEKESLQTLDFSILSKENEDSLCDPGKKCNWIPTENGDTL